MLRKARNHLEDETSSNNFVFTVFRFDTTSNALAYAFTRLAIYVEWQKEIINELDQALADTASRTLSTLSNSCD
jgi:hypothetical protein